MTKMTITRLGLFCLFVFLCKTSLSQPTHKKHVTDDWKIGIQTWTFRMFTLEEALNKADSAGIKYIEAFWGQPLGGGLADSFGSKMSAASRSQLKSWLQ